MKYRQLKLSVILLLGLGLTELWAQENINTSGGDASGSGGTVAYSVGQVTYLTHTGTNSSLAEGVQQPYEISLVTGIEGTEGVNLSVTVYPNPTSDFLTLDIDALTTLSTQSMTYQLHDMSGKLLRNEKITSRKTSIVTSNLVPATYFVKVIQGSKELKVFKIIKN